MDLFLIFYLTDEAHGVLFAGHLTKARWMCSGPALRTSDILAQQHTQAIHFVCRVGTPRDPKTLPGNFLRSSGEDRESDMIHRLKCLPTDILSSPTVDELRLHIKKKLFPLGLSSPHH